MRKWYVFDRFDCYDSFDTVTKAAVFVEWMFKGEAEGTVEGEKGIHVAYMTKAEADEYCITGKFPFSN